MKYIVSIRQLNFIFFVFIFPFISCMEKEKKLALISVSDKTNLIPLVKAVLDSKRKIISTGGTFEFINNEFIKKNINLVDQGYLEQVSDFTGFPPILEERVKTLHPSIHGGILADLTKQSHQDDLAQHHISPIDTVVVNLYPFKETVAKPNATKKEITEKIDIGGQTLIRSAAKNFEHVTVITNPADYQEFIETLRKNGNTTPEQREDLASKAWAHVADYDAAIANHFSGGKFVMRTYVKEQDLKYGTNPHQNDAALFKVNGGQFPFTVLNGTVGYINTLDALQAWQLVREAKDAFGITCTASFKHVSPAGVALGMPLIGMPLSPTLKKLYGVEEYERLNGPISETACAFIRTRNIDPKSSFGDLIAISDEVDETTAQFIKPEVSDGIIAPSYTPAAFEILKKKKEGTYLILQGNPEYKNGEQREFRELYGIALSQEPNRAVTNDTFLEKIVTRIKDLPQAAKVDLILANIALKYTQSNSVAYAKDGQVIGIGAGQQNRVDCVKLAGHKAALWHLRQHPKLLALFDKFKSGIKRQDKINAVIEHLEGAPLNPEMFTEKPTEITTEEIFEHLKKLSGVSLASDAFFPFPDSIHEAKKHGVGFLVEPGGSKADADVIRACDELEMVMAFSGIRMFTH